MPLNFPRLIASACTSALILALLSVGSATSAKAQVSLPSTPSLTEGFAGVPIILHKGHVWSGPTTYEDGLTPEMFKGLPRIVQIEGDIVLSHKGDVFELHQDCTIPLMQWKFYRCQHTGVAVKVPGLADVQQIAAGVRGTRIALKKDGSVWAWGGRSTPSGALSDDFGITIDSFYKLENHVTSYDDEPHTTGIVENNTHKSRTGRAYRVLSQEGLLVRPRLLTFLPPISDISTNGQIFLAATLSHELYVWGGFSPAQEIPLNKENSVMVDFGVYAPSGQFVTDESGRGAIKMNQFVNATVVKLWREFAWVNGVVFTFKPRRPTVDAISTHPMVPFSADSARPQIALLPDGSCVESTYSAKEDKVVTHKFTFDTPVVQVTQSRWAISKTGEVYRWPHYSGTENLLPPEAWAKLTQ